MAYISQKYNSKIVYDPSYLEIDHRGFKNAIGQRSIRVLRRLHQNLNVRRLISEFFWIISARTMTLSISQTA